jgi:hypothetical protein
LNEQKYKKNHTSTTGDTDAFDINLVAKGVLVFPDGVGKPGAKRRNIMLGNGSRRWWCERSKIVVRMPISMSNKSTGMDPVMIIRVMLLWVCIIMTRSIVGCLK